jgi:hypothetical protein
MFMGYSRFFSFFLILLIFLVSCTQQSQQSKAMPEKMPNDFNFSVKFGTYSKNEINSFEGTVTKDLVSNGIIIADSKFSEDEMRSIYNQMRVNNINKDLKLESIAGCMQTPFTEDSWEIQMNGVVTTYNWSTERCKLTEDAKKLAALRDFVFNMVKNKKEYKELPPAVGGYD